MAKRVYSSAVKKWAIGAGVTGVPLAILLFWYLSSLGAITITGFSGDQICSGTVQDPCIAYINMTAKEDIFIYPNENWSGGFYMNGSVKSTKLYRSWGTGWREINLTTNCKGTWCGAPDNSGKTVYSFAFRNNKEYQLKFEVLKNNPNESIKWGFANLDPIFYGIDNQYKEYSEKNREFFIKDNNFNTILFSGKLISDTHLKVNIGYQKVAEFEVNSSVNLDNFMTNIELYDLNNNSRIINRILYFKYMDYEDKLIYDYEIFCDKSILVNGTEIQECVQEITGNHIEKVVIWKDFNKSFFNSGNKNMGIFTNVEKGDYIEWIPTFYDFKITEWATWGNISTGSQAEVILISPADKNITTINTVFYNATANITGGAGLVNMSLWTNSTGTWHLNETKTIGEGISSVIQSHNQATTNDVTETQPLGRGFKFVVNQNVTLVKATKFALTTAATMDLYYSNGTSIANATLTSGNASFNIPLVAGQTYWLCAGGLTHTSWKASPTYPYNDTYVNFTNGVHCDDFGATENVIREILSITVNATTPQTFSVQNFSKIIPTTNTTWNVQACDTDGACGFAVNNRTIWYTPPNLISFVNPTAANGTIFNRNWIFMNVSVTETNFQNLTFNLYHLNGTSITSITFTNSTRQINVTGLANDIYYYNATTFDMVNNSNSTETREISLITSISVYFNNTLGNVTAERGNISIKANGTGNVTICFDIDGPEYSTNYFCTGGETIYITPNFTKQLFSDGTLSQGFNFSNLSSNSITIASHKYDEPQSLKFNITGVSNPYDTTIFYANSTPNLSNSTQYIPLIDRWYDGYLNNSRIYLNADQDGNTQKNLTYAFGYNYTIYFVLDDIFKIRDVYSFLLNLIGFPSGVEYKEGNNTIGSVGFDSYINISTDSTTHQDFSGVIMAKNVSRQMYLYDNLTDSSGVNTTLWKNTSCVIGPPTSCTAEVSGSGPTGGARGMNTFVYTIDGTGILGTTVVSRYNSLSYPESDIVNLSINSTLVVEKDSNDDGQATWHLKYGGTQIWFANASVESINVDEQTRTNLTIMITKVNRTTAERRLWGYENKTTLDPPSSNASTNYMFSGEASYFTITNNSAGFAFDADAIIEQDDPVIIINITTREVKHTKSTRANSTVVSNSVYDTGGKIESVIANFFGQNVAGESLTFYASADDGANWETVTNGVSHTFVNPGQHLRWGMTINITAPDNYNSTTHLWGVNLSVPAGNTSNITIDWGDDGIIDYTYSGYFGQANGTQQANLSNIDISDLFISTNKNTSINYGHTYSIPLKIASDSLGLLVVENFNMTYDPNPIEINVSRNLSNVLGNSTANESGFRIPIATINSTTSQARINISNMVYAYLGGRWVLNVTAHDTNYTVNQTHNITFYRSSFLQRLPYTWTDLIFFLPRTNSSKNVSAFGQTSTIPLINITMTNYAKNANLSIRINETFACLNLTWAGNGTKPLTGNIINTTNQQIESNIGYLHNKSIFIWADLNNCNATNQRILQPRVDIESYCIDCLR